MPAAYKSGLDIAWLCSSELEVILPLGMYGPT